MAFEPTKAEGLRVELLFAPEVGLHQEQLQDWLRRNADAEIVDIQFQVWSGQQPAGDTFDTGTVHAGGPGYATMILYRGGVPSAAETERDDRDEELAEAAEALRQQRENDESGT